MDEADFHLTCQHVLQPDLWHLLERTHLRRKNEDVQVRTCLWGFSPTCQSVDVEKNNKRLQDDLEEDYEEEGTGTAPAKEQGVSLSASVSESDNSVSGSKWIWSNMAEDLEFIHHV